MRLTEEHRALMREVNADPTASRLLGYKAAWEGMTRYAVLLEWGDPREWWSYVREVRLTEEAK